MANELLKEKKRGAKFAIMPEHHTAYYHLLLLNELKNIDPKSLDDKEFFKALQIWRHVFFLLAVR